MVHASVLPVCPAKLRLLSVGAPANRASPQGIVTWGTGGSQCYLGLSVLAEGLVGALDPPEEPRCRKR